MQSSIVAVPLSRKDIRDYARQIRRFANLENEYCFPILEFVENVLPVRFDDFVLEVCSCDEMGDCHGRALPEQSLIKIREDIYERAYNGEGRDRLTIAHELGHFLLHRPGKVSLARIPRGIAVPAYKDPEWQATAFAAELLMPANLIGGLSIYDISILCGVSLSAAQIQKRKIS
mgnify:CR=1 FL=1